MGIEDYQFKKGMEKVPGSGRKPGVRNRIGQKFLEDLQSEWERSGTAVLKILAVENPEALAKLAAGLLPREHDIEGPAVLIRVNTGVPRHGDVLPGAPRAPLIKHEDLLRLPRKDDSESDD